MRARTRLLAVDYGTVRVGLAVSDAERRIASPLTTYERRGRDGDERYFRKLVEEEEIGVIVVGLPVHTDGSEGQKAAEARARTGLHDFGGDEFREPLRRLLEGYETEAGFTPIGRLAARRDTRSLLVNRLRLVEELFRAAVVHQRERHHAHAGHGQLCQLPQPGMERNAGVLQIVGQTPAGGQ